MSLFEWFFERRNPGPRGSIDTETPDPGHWNPRVVTIRGVVAALLLAGAVGLVLATADSVGTAILALFVFAAYCALAYRLTPRPNLSNTGFLGFIDNPFRWSDDVNRGLVFLALILSPGRFITVSLRDLINQSRGRRVMVLPPRDQ